MLEEDIQHHLVTMTQVHKQNIRGNPLLMFGKVLFIYFFVTLLFHFFVHNLIILR